LFQSLLAQSAHASWITTLWIWLMLILAVGFLAGVTAGSLLFGAHQSAQTATKDGKTALAFFFDGSRNAT
jgi:hypothetical protein